VKHGTSCMCQALATAAPQHTASLLLAEHAYTTLDTIAAASGVLCTQTAAQKPFPASKCCWHGPQPPAVGVLAVCHPANLNTAQNSLLTRSCKLPCSSKSSTTLKNQQSCSSSWPRYACTLNSREVVAKADNSAHRRDTAQIQTQLASCEADCSARAQALNSPTKCLQDSRLCKRQSATTSACACSAMCAAHTYHNNHPAFMPAGTATERSSPAEAAAPCSSPEQQHQQHTSALPAAADANVAHDAGGHAAQGSHGGQHAADSSRHDASGSNK
jgi:hypothetical protein